MAAIDKSKEHIIGKDDAAEAKVEHTKTEILVAKVEVKEAEQKVKEAEVKGNTSDIKVARELLACAIQGLQSAHELHKLAVEHLRRASTCISEGSSDAEYGKAAQMPSQSRQ